VPIIKSGAAYKVGIHECEISVEGEELKFEIKGFDKMSFKEF